MMRLIAAVLALSFAVPGLYAVRLTKKALEGHGARKESCKKKNVCVVTSNAADRLEDGLHGLFAGCLGANAETEVIVLALQDFRGQSELPKYIDDPDLGLSRKHRFKMRDQMMLSKDGTGKNNVCHSKFLGGGMAMMAVGAATGAKVGSVVPGKGTVLGGLIGGIGGYIMGTFAQHKLGIGCGGVSVISYSLSKHDIDFAADEGSFAADKTEEDDASGATEDHGARGDKVRTSFTTLKGTVALKLGINGRKLVVASTHAQEGVRAKHRGEECPADPTPEDVSGEMKRVQDFRSGLAAIHQVATEETGILWGGDFNPRTVDAQSGCPIFDGDIRQMLESKDILGALPEGDGKQLTTFAKELSDFASAQGVPELGEVQMAPGEVCPTYNKDKNREKATSAETMETQQQFMCNSPVHGDMYYKYKKPPSWTDRIFKNNVDWLHCGYAQRIAHAEDHDAVFVTCEVASTEC